MFIKSSYLEGSVYITYMYSNSAKLASNIHVGFGSLVKYLCGCGGFEKTDCTD